MTSAGSQVVMNRYAECHGRWRQAEKEKQLALAAYYALCDDVPLDDRKRVYLAWRNACAVATRAFKSIPQP